MNLSSIAIGSFYIFSSIVLLLTYVVALVAIWNNKELRKLSCYRLILAIGQTDIIQILILGTQAGIASVAQVDGTTLFFRVCGALVISCWFGTSLLCMILAFNRFVICWSEHIANRIFQGKKTFFWIAAGYVYTLAAFIAYNFRDADFTYSSELHLWHYNQNRTLSYALSRVNVINDGITITIMTIFHVGILFMLNYKKLNVSARHLSKHELRAITPTFILSITFAFICIYYFVSQEFAPTSVVIIGAEVGWLYAAGLNGVLFVIFHHSIKKQVRQMFCRNLAAVHAAAAIPGPSGQQSQRSQRSQQNFARLSYSSAPPRVEII